jgi:hypothetical protein
MSRIVIVILIYHRHKPVDSINLLVSWRRRNVLPVRYGKPKILFHDVVFLNIRQIDDVQNYDGYINTRSQLTYRQH